MKHSTKHMILAALCLAIAFILPPIFGPALNKVWCPMHIAIFLCAYMADKKWATLVGFLAPILRSILFAMPPMYPTAIAMAFELATYGFVCGLLNEKLPKSTKSIYISLITAMIIGRIVWGVVSWMLYTFNGDTFTLSMFLSGAVITSIFGIVLQIVVIPLIIIALRKAKLLDTPHHHSK